MIRRAWVLRTRFTVVPPKKIHSQARYRSKVDTTNVFFSDQCNSCFLLFLSSFSVYVFFSFSFSVPIPLLHVLLLVYILPFALHPYRTRVDWVRKISFCPIWHLLELPMGSCKAASLLFRYHLHINAARELVERSLMRRQL